MSKLDLEGRPEAPSLASAEWLARPETKLVFAALGRDGAETRAVGGAVRDALLGRDFTEIDLATTALPEQVLELAERAGLKAVPTGIEHGTVTIVAGKVPFEVTTLRRDVETFGRHAKIAYTKSWEEDARRRDFTLNSLYASQDGTVFDPLGGGFTDLAAGRVRFIGAAEDRIKEDFLRILRFFRFHAYYGKGEMDPAGLHASLKLRAGLESLSAERVGGELKRILIAPGAMGAVEALYDYGLLTDLLGGVPRLGRFERLIAIDDANDMAASVALRLAALAVFVTEDVGRLARRLRLSNAEQDVLALGAAETMASALPDEAAAKERLYRLGPAPYRTFVLLAWADTRASPDEQAWRRALALPDRWQAPRFPLSGHDLMALGKIEGPDIGAALKRLEQEWVKSGFGLDREQLLVRARRPVALRD